MKEWDKNIELRSDDVKDIIGKPPSWLVKWGTIAICFIVLLLIVGSAWFNYPDRLNSRVTILGDQPPLEIISKSDGFIDTMLVVDNQDVSKNEVLAVIQSSVDYTFVTVVQADLDSIMLWIENQDLKSLNYFVSRHWDQSGELKTDFSELRNSINAYMSFVSLEKYADKIIASTRELRNTKIHFDRLFEQRLLRQDELKLAEKQFSRQESLFESGTISESEFEIAKQLLLDKKFQYEQTRSDLSSYQIKIDQINSQISEYKILEKEDISRLISDVERKLTTLKGAISEWELNYLFRSQISGKVSFNKFWTTNQAVRVGEKVMTILPAQSSKTIGKLALPVSGSGKAKVGQTVLIKVDNFPYMEYGVLKGIIKSISLVSEEDFFTVEIAFPDGLVTSYNRELNFSQGMVGNAEIITENMSFLVRIVNPIRFLLKQNRIVE